MRRTVGLFLVAFAGCYEPEASSPITVAASEPTVQSAGDVEARILEPNQVVDRAVDTSGVHNYRVRLHEGELLHVRVDQDDVDAAIALRTADGSLVRTADSPGSCGPEELWWVATNVTDYRLEVILPGQVGHYRIWIESPRLATEFDVLATVAQGAYLEGRELFTARDYRQAAESFRAAFRLWQRTLEPRQELLSLVALAWSEMEARDLESAVVHFEEALAVARGLAEQRQEARILSFLGLAQRRQVRYLEAAQNYREALELAQRIHYSSVEGTAAHNLAVLFHRRGETEKALSLYERARTIRHRLGDASREASTLRNLGACYMLLNRHTDALDVLEQALELTERDADVAKTLNTMGWFHHLNGQPEKAITSYRRALEMRDEVEPNIEAGILDRLGTAYTTLGQWHRAVEFYDQALAILRRDGYRLGEGHTLANLCRLYELSGGLEQGLETCGRSLAILQRVGDANAEAYALYVRARLERRLGDSRSALANIETTLERVERLRAVAGSETMKMAFFEDQIKYYEFYVDLLMEFHTREPEAGWDARALEASERSRARSLLELLAIVGADIYRDVDSELIEAERWLVARIEEAERYLRSRHGADLVTAKRELRQLLRQYDGIQHKIRRASPIYAAHTRPQPIELARIQRLLDDRTLLCVFSLGEERSFLWVVDRTGIESHQLPERAAIESLARRWYELLSDRQRQTAARGQRQQMAEGLSNVLLHPIAERLRDHQRLAILSDGALHYVPFAALPLPTDGRRMPAPLFLSHEVVHLPSASVLELLRTQLADRQPAPGIVAVVANPALGPGWRPLPETGREAAAILALAPSDQRLLIEGPDVNRDRLFSGELAGYRILHFATHGVLDAAHPTLSGLVVSQLDEFGSPGSAYLRAHEIYNLELQAEMVVLSACRTALGHDVRGEGLVGLTRAFYYAGVPRVVVSLWDVEDKATASLMERFYRNLLRNGFAPPAALREAQREMWREGWEPYRWAGFILQGEWRSFDTR